MNTQDEEIHTLAETLIDELAKVITWFRRARLDRQRLPFMYQLARQMLSGGKSSV